MKAYTFRYGKGAVTFPLDPALVIDELDMSGYGFAWFPANAGLFVPFEDGTSVQLWEDEDACAAALKQVSVIRRRVQLGAVR